MKDKVRRVLLELVEQRKGMRGLGEDENYFDHGVSSLTIVELQVAVESALGVTIPTKQLMRLSSIREWIEPYAAALGEAGRRRETEATAASLAGEPQ